MTMHSVFEACCTPINNKYLCLLKKYWHFDSTPVFSRIFSIRFNSLLTRTPFCQPAEEFFEKQRKKAGSSFWVLCKLKRKISFTALLATELKILFKVTYMSMLKKKKRDFFKWKVAKNFTCLLVSWTHWRLTTHSIRF